MKVRRKKLDNIFSLLVRERANWYCQACSTNKKMEPGTLDCAHIFSRRNLATRYHPQNAVALCRSCHMFYTEHWYDWREWCVEQFGEEFVAKLRLLSNSTVKWTTKQREEIYQFYKDQYRIQLLKRLDTELMIDFEPHELMELI